MTNRTLDLFADPVPRDGGADRPPPPRVWTVRQVNRASRLLLEDSLPRLWVGGEVANFRRQRSGHCYFTLKDEAAQLRCVMFRRDAARLPADPDEGMTLRVLGRLTLYEARGVFQLVVSRLEAESEGGMWKLAFDRLRARLDAEGLTDPGRKRALPAFPGTVGIVTSPTSAALRDIVAVVARRAPWLRLLVRGTRVQGPGAGDEIAAAVSTLARAPGVEVIIVARGGGSIEDLWGFNREAVARAVARSPVPVVSGVGHETDVTICDLVADVRAATPSAAAETVAPDREWVAKRLEAMGRRLGRGLAGQVRSRRWWLEHLGDSLFRRGRRRVGESRERVAAARLRMAVAMRGRIRRQSSRLSRAAASLDALSPLSTLARGYAVPLGRDGDLLRRTGDFRRGRDFRLRVLDGYVPCSVTGRPREAATRAAGERTGGGDRGA